MAYVIGAETKAQAKAYVDILRREANAGTPQSAEVEHRELGGSGEAAAGTSVNSYLCVVTGEVGTTGSYYVNLYSTLGGAVVGNGILQAAEKQPSEPLDVGRKIVATPFNLTAISVSSGDNV